MKLIKREAKGTLAEIIKNMSEDSLNKTREKMYKEILESSKDIEGSDDIYDPLFILKEVNKNFKK